LTKESGKLVKVLVINDLRGAGFFASREKRFFKVLGQSAEMLEYLCPQQQMKAVLMNPPIFMSAMFGFLKPLMPKKALAKVSVCHGETLHGAFGDCPFAKMWWPEQNVPDFLGGQYRVSEGHRLFVAPAAPVEAAQELEILPQMQETLELTVPTEGEARVAFQLMCLPHGMALHPGVEMKASFMSLGALADGADTVGRVIMPAALWKVQDGRCSREWVVNGPGVVAVILSNQSKGRHKQVRYSLQLVAADVGNVKPGAEAATAAVAMAQAVEDVQKEQAGKAEKCSTQQGYPEIKMETMIQEGKAET
jgi:hypothetical protein